MSRDFYILDEHNEAVPIDDALTWQQWLEDNRDRELVGYDEIGPYYVSTRFFGFEMHTPTAIFGGRGPCHLFETMAFDRRSEPPEIVYQERCATWQQAEYSHSRGVAEVKRIQAG